MPHIFIVTIRENLNAPKINWRFHRGKFFRYNDPAKDVRGLVAFALHKFKEQRGHRVPDPPTALENFYEHVKERVSDAIVSR